VQLPGRARTDLDVIGLTRHIERQLPFFPSSLLLAPLHHFEHHDSTRHQPRRLQFSLPFHEKPSTSSAIPPSRPAPTASTRFLAQDTPRHHSRPGSDSPYLRRRSRSRRFLVLGSNYRSRQIRCTRDRTAACPRCIRVEELSES
jgi:hypothetical protein